MKRRTRETEARRVGNLVSSSCRKEQQDEARNRYQSGVTYSSQLNPLSTAQPLALWQRTRAIQARLKEAEAIGEPYRTQAVNGNRNNEHNQFHTVQASTMHAEHPTSRSQPPPEQPVSQLNGGRPWLDADEQQRSSNSQVDTAASQVTYIDSTVTNNNFTFGTSSSVPNITINVTTSPPGANKRPVGSGDEEESNVQSEEPPALPTRSRKRARTDRS